MVKKLFVVKFMGYFPVGAVAVSSAPTHAAAAVQVWDELPKTLQAVNSPASMAKDAFELKLEQGETILLLDGNY